MFVSNCPGKNSSAVAELVIGLMVAIDRCGVGEFYAFYPPSFLWCGLREGVMPPLPAVGVVWLVGQRSQLVSILCWQRLTLPSIPPFFSHVCFLVHPRRIPENVTDARNGMWNKKTYSKADGLSGRTLGVIGCGNIGQGVLQRAYGFNMRCCAWSRSLTPGIPALRARVRSRVVIVLRITMDTTFLIHRPAPPPFWQRRPKSMVPSTLTTCWRWWPSAMSFQSMWRPMARRPACAGASFSRR